MLWEQAFLIQARSDDLVRLKLNRPDVEYCHRLHYLQMVTEKLAKGLTAPPARNKPPIATHLVFSQFLQGIKGRREYRNYLGYKDWSSYRNFINSLLPLARDIERLAPSAAGFTRQNPEYPWQEKANGPVVAPADYDFPAYNAKSPQMLKLEKLLSRLLVYKSGV